MSGGKPNHKTLQEFSLVSPVIVPPVIKYCVRHKIPVFPGALTPREIYEVWQAGATMVKTSTGFNSGGATLEDVRLMRATVPARMGVKASGGIRDTATALAMIEAGANRLGTSAGLALVRGFLSGGPDLG